MISCWQLYTDSLLMHCKKPSRQPMHPAIISLVLICLNSWKIAPHCSGVLGISSTLVPDWQHPKKSFIELYTAAGHVSMVCLWSFGCLPDKICRPLVTICSTIMGSDLWLSYPFYCTKGVRVWINFLWDQRDMKYMFSSNPSCCNCAIWAFQSNHLCSHLMLHMEWTLQSTAVSWRAATSTPGSLLLGYDLLSKLLPNSLSLILQSHSKIHHHSQCHHDHSRVQCHEWCQIMVWGKSQCRQQGDMLMVSWHWLLHCYGGEHSSPTAHAHIWCCT